jgi:hypothetical protein
MEGNVWVATLDESHRQEETINLVSPKGVSIILIKKDGHIYALRGGIKTLVSGPSPVKGLSGSPRNVTHASAL